MYNQVGLMGRLARTPELKRTQNGISITSFTLAADRDFKNESGSRDTDWIDCVAWRGIAEFIAKNFQRGQSILVKGRLQSRNWTDAGGNNRRAVEILVDGAYFCGSAPARNAAPNYEQHDPSYFEVPEKEEIPF